MMHCKVFGLLFFIPSSSFILIPFTRRGRKVCVVWGIWKSFLFLNVDCGGTGVEWKEESILDWSAMLVVGCWLLRGGNEDDDEKGRMLDGYIPR